MNIENTYTNFFSVNLPSVFNELPPDLKRRIVAFTGTPSGYCMSDFLIAYESYMLEETERISVIATLMEVRSKRERDRFLTREILRMWNDLMK
jgi:hypothetical protein